MPVKKEKANLLHPLGSKKGWKISSFFFFVTYHIKENNPCFFSLHIVRKVLAKNQSVLSPGILIRETSWHRYSGGPESQIGGLKQQGLTPACWARVHIKVMCVGACMVGWMVVKTAASKGWAKVYWLTWILLGLSVITLQLKALSNESKSLSRTGWSFSYQSEGNWAKTCSHTHRRPR